MPGHRDRTTLLQAVRAGKAGSVRSVHSLWHDRGWPVVTGVVTAYGLVAAAIRIGVPSTVVILLFTAMATAMFTWCLVDEGGSAPPRALVTPALDGGLGCSAGLGLVLSLHLWALPVLAVVVLTSGAGRSPLRSVRTHGDARERAELRGRFDQIVSDGFQAPGDGDHTVPR